MNGEVVTNPRIPGIFHNSVLWHEMLEFNYSYTANITKADTAPPKCWLALLTLMVIVPTIGGNILVILAVSLEKKLQNATNYFLMSLAVADLLVGIFVMPIALVTIMFKPAWPLPQCLCAIWLFLDVLFSTASIIHLCAISLDRYIAIKKPIQASQFNTRAKTLIKIAVVWIISAVIAVPIPIQGLLDPETIFNTNHTCVVRTEFFKYFIISGSMAAFFVPFAIMVVIYFLTIHLLRKKAYLIKNKPPQRINWSTVSTVFQRDTAPGSSPEKVAMLDSQRRERTLQITSDEMPIRRLSSVGKKSMQTITNEQRASKVLGIVFFLFVFMWCPFFITNVASVLCDPSDCDPEVIQMLMEIFVWVGYISSGVNPLVYTLFNKTFRDAFGRYITCNFRGLRPVGIIRNCSSRISFRNSMAENSKLIMKHGMKNGINPVMYQSPLRMKNSQLESSAILLDTLLLTENEAGKTDEQVSYV
ncbi:5-hydroxytryptamine receptor 2B isoform X1 [Dendrobates tinctorius]|uniref:5-hydroxytryptamine receptor 2B isoform X1 n=1 Tax=Dendrobates tinctorius TaxID=92724 RepID=UPI003CC9A482